MSQATLAEPSSELDVSLASLLAVVPPARRPRFEPDWVAARVIWRSCAGVRVGGPWEPSRGDGVRRSLDTCLGACVGPVSNTWWHRDRIDAFLGSEVASWGEPFGCDRPEELVPFTLFAVAYDREPGCDCPPAARTTEGSRAAGRVVPLKV